MLGQADDFARRLSGVLEVAETVVRVLIAERWESEGDNEEPSREKVLSETALLLLFAARIDESYTPIHQQIKALAGQLAPHARSESVAAGVTLAPRLAREYAAAHACLSRLGYPDPEFDHVLARSLESGLARTRERVPYRQLELEWLSGVWDPVRIPLRRDLGLRAKTTAGIGLDALSLTRDDVYAFTHSLVYMTDFGRNFDDLPRTTTELVADAEPALARCLDDDDFDLSGELLLTWPLLRAAWSPSSTFALRVLTRVEDEVGFLPSLSLRTDRYRELEGDARKRYTVAQAYHTVYVMGLLCAATLQWGSLPQNSVVPQTATAISKELIDRLIATEPEPQWRRDFGDLTTAEQYPLATFVATVALQRAVSACDLERARSILALCVEYELAPSVAMTQVADLLRRFAKSPYAYVDQDRNRVRPEK